MAPATKDSEVWVISVKSDGTVPETAEVSSVNNNSGGNVHIGTPLMGDFQFGGDVDIKNPSSSSEFLTKEVQTLIWFVIIFALLLFVVAVIQTKRERERKTSRALVFSYLQAFEPENIDVRHSATGGWHGTYVGPLAEGKSKSHSSIVKDSLFVDYDLGDFQTDPRTPRRQFTIGEEDDLGPNSPEEPLGTPYTDDEDRELDAVDLRIGSIPDIQEEETNPWGKEIV